MTELNTLYFLIHGFCYGEMARGRSESEDSRFGEYLAAEKRCSEKWRQAVLDMSEDYALVILPWSHDSGGPAGEFEDFATRHLGDRCFILDKTRIHEPAFWEGRSREFLTDVLSDIRSAFLGQGYDWNKEELDTALHSRSAAEQLTKMMDNRGFSIKPKELQAEARGASFEGCVIKYSCNLRRLLGLSNVIEIEFDKSVPDTHFLLRVGRWERIPLGDDLRLFLFDVDGRPVGIFVETKQSPSDPPSYVEIGMEPDGVTVMTKWEGEIWPGPVEEKTPGRGIGFYEPPQDLVGVVDGSLRVPVCAGMAYRLAKAPAFIFGPAGMSWQEFRDLMVKAKLN